MAKNDKSKDDSSNTEKPSKIEVNVPPEFGYIKWENLRKNWQQRQRKSMLWFGLFLLALGILWYAVVKGFINAALICPGLLIIIGAILVLKVLITYLTS